MSKYFYDGVNNLLQQIQEEAFVPMGGFLFSHPAYLYKDAIRLVGIETDLWKIVNELIWNGYNHNPLQPVYDLIAAYFRFRFYPYGQLPLPFDPDKTTEQIFAEEWRSYFINEVRELCSNDEYVRHLLRIVAYPDQENGIAALQDMLVQLNEGRYCMERKVEDIPEEELGEEEDS